LNIDLDEYYEDYEMISTLERREQISMEEKKSKERFQSLKNSFFKEYEHKSIGDKTIYYRELFHLTFTYDAEYRIIENKDKVFSKKHIEKINFHILDSKLNNNKSYILATFLTRGEFKTYCFAKSHDREITEFALKKIQDFYAINNFDVNNHFNLTIFEED